MGMSIRPPDGAPNANRTIKMPRYANILCRFELRQDYGIGRFVAHQANLFPQNGCSSGPA
jgi:hypothetical protein